MDNVSELLGTGHRGLGKAIRMVEDMDPTVEKLLHPLRERPRTAYVAGLTGPPGSGKSTLTDQLIAKWRERKEDVGVLAVDPSSPFSGGAVLGDRIRMQRHATDRGVYIRSLAARGHLGGLAPAVRDAIRLLDAMGMARVVVETVGVGQSELEVMGCADTTVVVVTPVTGDSVQAIKAGILEIADIFVVNKADIDGVERVTRELREMIRNSKSSMSGGWTVPVIQTCARDGAGIDKLVETLDVHWKYMKESGELAVRRHAQWEAEVEAIVVEQATRAVRDAFAAKEGGSGPERDPYDIAHAILTRTFSAIGGS